MLESAMDCRVGLRPPRNDEVFLKRLCALSVSRAHLSDGFAREFIAAFIFRMAGVTLHPMERHIMQRAQFIKPLPEIDILHRLFIGGFPAARFPPINPIGEAFAQILAVGVKIDNARML